MFTEMWSEYNKHSGNTTEISGVGAEAAELKGVWVVLVASLEVPVCVFLFRTQSTLSSVSLRTKH